MKILPQRVKRYLERYKLYQVAREIKWCLHRSLKEADNTDRIDRRVVSLKPDGPSRGNVLLSYILDPFLLKPNEPIPHSHTNYWESMEMAKTFLDLGYSVDAISYRNTEFIPHKKYSIFIDARWNLQRLSPLIDKDCVKIMHVDLCHMLFNNAAEANRLLALQQRRGVTLPPRRFELPNLAIEYADCATVLGNEFTINTFRYANKPIYRVPISNPFIYPWPEKKDFEACRKRYLWFGSGGLVRKGLDLILEAFVGMPDYHLIVCGPIKEEKDFEMAYYKELYETPNISTIGWVDVSKPEFLEITNRCIGIVFPSAAEGGGGSVITCMHAGLIPIVSYEASVDVDDDYGLVLKNCSIEEIQNSIRKISMLSEEKLKSMARKAWQFVRVNNTQQRFSEEYRKTIDTILTHQVHKNMKK
jgi:hypothetical protein